MCVVLWTKQCMKIITENVTDFFGGFLEDRLHDNFDEAAQDGSYFCYLGIRTRQGQDG